MAKGIYVGVDETHELSEFTSSRAPTSWTNSGNGKTATATNSYGEWKITASQIQDATSYNTIHAFDNSEYSYWHSGNLSSDSTFVWCGIYLPEGVSINPKKFSLNYDDFRNAHIQGLNETTGGWENIVSLTDTSSTLSVTPGVTTNNYYKAFRVAGYRYSSSYKNPALDSFLITSGTMKIPNIKNNIARKVTKAYIGVDSVARKVKKGYIGVGGKARLFYEYDPFTYITFTSCPFPKSWTDSGDDYGTATSSNTYGKWTITSSGYSQGAPKNAFDRDTSTSYGSKEISRTGYGYVQISTPSGVTIKPSAIYLRYYSVGDEGCFQGLNADTNTLETLRNLTANTSGAITVQTNDVTINSTKYYSSFRIYSNRLSVNSTTFKVYELQVKGGTLKMK